MPVELCHVTSSWSASGATTSSRSRTSSTCACIRCARNSACQTSSTLFGAPALSFGRKFGRQFRALHWRLALFYTSVLALMLLALGVYLDRQLSTFALTQLQDRLIARAGGPAERQRAGLPP